MGVSHALWGMCVNSAGLEMNSWIHLVWREKKKGKAEKEMDGSRCGLLRESAVVQLCWVTNQTAIDRVNSGSRFTGSFHCTGGLTHAHAGTQQHIHPSRPRPQRLIIPRVKEVDLYRKNNASWARQTFLIAYGDSSLNKKTSTIINSLPYELLRDTVSFVLCPVCDLAVAAQHARIWLHPHTTMTFDEWALRWTQCVCPRSVF